MPKIDRPTTSSQRPAPSIANPRHAASSRCNRRKLSHTISALVLGPAALTVADARAREGTDAALVFAVSLSRLRTFVAMASLDDRLHAAVRVHLARSGLSVRRVGARALGDSGFVASLTKGRRWDQPTPDLWRASGFRLYSMLIQAAASGLGGAIGRPMLIA